MQVIYNIPDNLLPYLPPPKSFKSLPPQRDFKPPTDFDFIEHFYKAKDMTRYWNMFRVRPQVAGRFKHR